MPEQFERTFCFLHSPLASAEMLETVLLHMHKLIGDVPQWSEGVCSEPEDAPAFSHEAMFETIYSSAVVVLCLSDRLVANESVQFCLRAAQVLRRKTLMLVMDRDESLVPGFPEDLMPLMSCVASHSVHMSVHMKRDVVIKRVLAAAGRNLYEPRPEPGADAAPNEEAEHFQRMLAKDAPRPPPLRAVHLPEIVVDIPKPAALEVGEPAEEE